ncbi:hypothetical protein BJ742DRAFT_845207 [Cladochytrium replicatum]|nr:hypothetical protein BJ742DRAFT_845207 [Cladochytrium replicatum]
MSNSERTPLLPTANDNGKQNGTARAGTHYLSAIAAAVGLAPSNNAPQQPKPQGVQTMLRVEPKVYFANERTFLSWLHFCIVLGGLAIGLFNFGDRVGMIAGFAFTLVALMFMIYALYLYLKRTSMIRNRDPGPYDDTRGPVVLVITLIAAILLNFWLKFVSFFGY